MHIFFVKNIYIFPSFQSRLHGNILEHKKTGIIRFIMKRDISSIELTVVRQCFQNTLCGMCLLTMSYFFMFRENHFAFIKTFLYFILVFLLSVMTWVGIISM